MKKYNFLFKPVFFIFNLLFATWLVLKIEEIKPSDFSKRPSFFKNKTSSVCATCGSVLSHADRTQQMSALKYQHLSLKKLCIDYKHDLVDSTFFDRQLKKILQLPERTPAK